MSKLKCWFAGSKNPFEYSFVEAVFANSHREARKIVWSKGHFIQEECDHDFLDLNIERQKQFDSLAEGDAPYVVIDEKVLHQLGWINNEDGYACDTCGGGMLPICQECNQCEVCGCLCGEGKV